ncbi:hypothetical protein [Kitasatospora sp. NPDC005856]|uniref:hypothetical protein n=1 Tax=Kitasatospora sp. NPDC005856 TaxID=3154566 RepID=UPI0033D4F0C2
MEPTERRNRFDYVDIINIPFFAIRIGRTVVVSAMQDWGALAEAVELPGLEAAKHLDLHPQQLREVAALTAYTTKLFNRTPKHLLHAPSPVHCAGTPPARRPRRCPPPIQRRLRSDSI